MTLLTYCVRLAHPGHERLVDVARPLEAKDVDVVSG